MQMSLELDILHIRSGQLGIDAGQEHPRLISRAQVWCTARCTACVWRIDCSFQIWVTGGNPAQPWSLSAFAALTWPAVS